MGVRPDAREPSIDERGRMRVTWMWWTAVFCFTTPLSGAAEITGVQLEPAPVWAEIIDAKLTETPAEDVSHGWDYLLLQRHVNAAEEATHSRAVYRITAESALQSGARLTWTFDPAYEQLAVHHVRLIRDGVMQDRLSKDSLKVIQQERELDRHVLNGHLTAFVVLEDVRVGDVIDYASTRHGWNPTYGGRYFDSLQTSWAVPVRHQRFRLDMPAERGLQWKGHGPEAAEIVATRDGAQATYVWEGRDLRPREWEAETPGWFNAYSFWQFTELRSWAEAVAWAEPLYALPDTLPETLVEQVGLLTRNATTPEEKTIAILDFVQQEVRYLGMELGAGSYRPNPPATVLARRFGDCKDKTTLFCALMRAAGLEAYPALVDTDYTRRIADWLPSPHTFDHVIAAIPRDEGYVWVDPTLTHQSGGLNYRGLPDYGKALVVRPGDYRLSEISIPEGAKSTTRIEERFDVPAFDQPAKFQVTTRFTGRRADSARRYLSSNTPDQIAKDYVNYYESVYPGVKSVSPVTWTEDTAKNSLTTVEVYEVPGLWTTEENGSREAEFFPKNISDCATRPQRAVRLGFLEVAHPLDLELTTIVNLPEVWSVKNAEKVTEDDAFRATAGIEGKGKVVTMRYSWRSKTDHVAAERVATYVKTLNAYRDSLGYTLTWGGATSNPASAHPVPQTTETPFRLNWLMVLVTLVTATLGTLGAVKVARWQPKTPPPLLAEPEVRLAGLGGWLILVGFGVTLRPVMLMFSTATAMGPSFNLDVWENVTLVGRSTYQAGLGPLIVCEMIGNTLLIVISVLALVLFYSKKRAFPITFVVLMAFSLLVVVGDATAVSLLLEQPTSSAQEIGQAVGGAAVWIPYMLVSRRVRATFTR